MRLMPLRSALAILAVTATSCAGTRTKEQRTDLVVFGRVHAQEYIRALDEYGVSGLMTARLSIERVETGVPPSSVLPIQFIAHGFFREDRLIRLRLRQSGNGVFLVCGEGGRGYICG